MRRIASFLAVALLAAGISALPKAASAHDPGLSSAIVIVLPDRIDATVRFHVTDLPSDPLARAALLESPLLFHSAGNPIPVPPAVVTSAGPEHFHAHIEARVPGTNDLDVRSPLFDRLPRGHRQYLRSEDAAGELLSHSVLSAEAPGLRVTRSVRTSSVWQFMRLGFDHILVGWDHLLFLSVLLIACHRLLEVVRVITTFTIAHSASLAISVVVGVQLPPALVEPAIAASVVYMAVRNLITRAGSSERGLLTFAFGLVHGLGFAGQLSQSLAGSGTEVVAPLFGFNVGVELGQLSVAAFIVPLLWLARRSALFVRAGVPGLSAAAALLGMLWLLERTVS